MSIIIQCFFQGSWVLNCPSATETRAMPGAWLCPGGDTSEGAPHGARRAVPPWDVFPTRSPSPWPHFRGFWWCGGKHSGTFPERSLGGPGGGRGGLAAHRGGRGRAPACPGRQGLRFYSAFSGPSAALSPPRPFSPPSVSLGSFQTSSHAGLLLAVLPVSPEPSQLPWYSLSAQHLPCSPLSPPQPPRPSRRWKTNPSGPSAGKEATKEHGVFYPLHLSLLPGERGGEISLPVLTVCFP